MLHSREGSSSEVHVDVVDSFFSSHVSLPCIKNEVILPWSFFSDTVLFGLLIIEDPALFLSR